MPDTTVQLPDGRTLVIPEGTSPDQMAQLRNKLATKYSNPVTGQGMEAAAGAKEQERIGQPLVQAADEHITNQTKLGERMNRASRSPTPFTNAIAAVNPVGTAKMLAGSKIGSYIGEKVSPEYGGVLGGLLGGISPALGEGYIQGAARKVLLDPVTREPTVTPTSIAKRVLRTPEEAGQIQADQLESKMNDYQTGRQKELADMEQLKEQHAKSLVERGVAQDKLDTADAVPISQGPKGAEYQALNAIRRTNLRRSPIPLSQSPYVNQHAAAADFAAGKAGPFNPVSDSPNIAGQAFKPFVEPGAPLPSADDFYSREGAIRNSIFQRAQSDMARSRSESTAFPQPLRPLIGTPEDWATYERQMDILRPEASDAGTYHAARGATSKKLTLQERMGKKLAQ